MANLPPTQRQNAPAPRTQTAAPAGAVATTKPQPAAVAHPIRDLVAGEHFRNQIIKALPAHCDGQRMLQIMYNALDINPKLLDCSQESFVRACMKASSLGLELNGEQAHLVPYGRECTFIADYKGLIELVDRSGKFDFVEAVPVYENDLFKIARGTNPQIVHEPIIDGQRGEFLGCYALAWVKGASRPKFDWMNKDEIFAIRDKSPARNAGPWVANTMEMCKKTMLRRLMKTLPKSAELRQPDLDDDYEDEMRARMAKPANVVETPVPALKEPKPRTLAPPPPVVLPDPQPAQSAPPADADPLGLNDEPSEEEKAAIAQFEQEKALEEATKNKAAKEAEDAAKAAAKAPPASSNAPPAQLPARTAQEIVDIDLAGIRKQLAENGLDESNFRQYLFNAKRLPLDMPIEKICTISPRVITTINLQFATVLPKIKAAK